jgi:hypothetical protein
MRAWMKRKAAGRRAAGRPAPGPAPVPAPAAAVADTRDRLPPARRLSDWLIGLGVVGAQIYWAAKSFRPKSRA